MKNLLFFGSSAICVEAIEYIKEGWRKDVCVIYFKHQESIEVHTSLRKLKNVLKKYDDVTIFSLKE